MKKVVCIVVDKDFTPEDILTMDQYKEITVTGQVQSIFYGVEEFDKTLGLAQRMEELIESGEICEDEEDEEE